MLGEETQTVGPGSIVYIPEHHVHGIKNIGTEALKLMWMFPTDTWTEVEYLFET